MRSVWMPILPRVSLRNDSGGACAVNLRIGRELGVLGISEMGKSIFPLIRMAGIFISVWLEGCCAIADSVVASRTTASDESWDLTIAGPSQRGKDVPAIMVFTSRIRPFYGLSNSGGKGGKSQGIS